MLSKRQRIEMLATITESESNIIVSMFAEGLKEEIYKNAENKVREALVNMIQVNEKAILQDYITTTLTLAIKTEKICEVLEDMRK